MTNQKRRWTSFTWRKIWAGTTKTWQRTRRPCYWPDNSRSISTTTLGGTGSTPSGALQEATGCSPRSTPPSNRYPWHKHAGSSDINRSSWNKLVYLWHKQVPLNTYRYLWHKKEPLTQTSTSGTNRYPLTQHIPLTQQVLPTQQGTHDTFRYHNTNKYPDTSRFPWHLQAPLTQTGTFDTNRYHWHKKVPLTRNHFLLNL